MSRYDVICIGGGGAAVTAAVFASRTCRVALVSKEPAGYGDTRMAAGNMAYPGLAEGDSCEALVKDMVAAGKGLNNPELAAILARNSPAATGILEGFGAVFQRDAAGRLSDGVAIKSGGHAFPRSLICAPSGGVAIGTALRAAAIRSGVRMLEETAVCRILVSRNRVRGVVCLSLKDGRVFTLRAGAVVIAAGGGGWLYYPATDCSRGSTGDSYALAYEAGAELVDMEQVQFVPFALTHPSSFRGVFLGEPNLAGPRGVLKNNSGAIIMENINTRTRAEVAGAMALEIRRGGGTGHGGLYLDLSPNLETGEGRNLRQVLAGKGQLEILRKVYGEECYRWRKPIDVAPSAHYFMGGVRVDAGCRSRVEGLFAAGQAQGGVHGGNRLGSTSLAELFVFGAMAGENAALHACGADPESDAEETGDAVEAVKKLFGNRGEFRPGILIGRLQKTMRQHAGVVRDSRGLKQALQEIDKLAEMASNLSVAAEPVYNMEVVEAIELSHMLTTARAIVISASERRESCGAHVRADEPIGTPVKTYNVLVEKKESGMQVTRQVRLNHV